MPTVELSDGDLTIRVVSDKPLSITHTNINRFIAALRRLDGLSPLQEWIADRQPTPGTLKITFQDGREILATTVQNSIRVLDWNMTGVFELRELRAVFTTIEAVDTLADQNDLQTLDVSLN